MPAVKQKISEIPVFFVNILLLSSSFLFFCKSEFIQSFPVQWESRNIYIYTIIYIQLIMNTLLNNEFN